MKNLLFLAAIFIASTSIVSAQLFVRPNPTTLEDSYIYAKDVQIYVDGEINLEENATANPVTDTLQASIYLRDDAQLFQGDPVVPAPNAGTGSISVLRSTNSDAYDYNYWASPVSQSTGTGNQNFGIARLHDPLGVTESNPASLTTNLNGASSPLQISRRWLYGYNAGTGSGGSYYFLESNNMIPAGEGFLMKGVDVTATPDQIYDFRGRPNSGDITIDVPPSTFQTNALLSTLMNGEAATGNPYPSTLDLNAFLYDAANIGLFKEIKFYDEDRSINSHFYVDNKAGYSTWTPGPEDLGGTQSGNQVTATFLNFDNDGNPVSSTGMQGTTVPRRMSPIAQGFIIQGDPSPGMKTATFRNSHRRFIKESSGNSTFKNQENKVSPISSKSSSSDTPSGDVIEDETIQPQIRINTYFGTSHMRQTLLIFDDNATDDYDSGLDGFSPMDATSEMFFPVFTPWDSENTYPLVISSLPVRDRLKRIPFTLQLASSMNVVITGEENLNRPMREVLVYDSFKNTYQKITENRSASLFLKAGLYENRFFIVFTVPHKKGNETDQITQKAKDAVTFFQNNLQTQLEVSNPERFELKKASIFDMRGRLVLNQENLGGATKLTFPTGTFSDGIYLVILTTSDNAIIDYKISVRNR
ncbi:hypothetical protein [Patiriisocius sp. Uisw_017]|jgi:hypothetical protein|uniref:hypothetical protein n=1 Tax=Patiriisocius sp. Uisw_017 TaxID=3230968 RepID=UPI0039E99036